jgi:hypothetical protein
MHRRTNREVVISSVKEIEAEKLRIITLIKVSISMTIKTTAPT